MAIWGVPYPAVGRIEGQPIIDLRLEDICASLIELERRDTSRAVLDREYTSETLKFILERHNEIVEKLKQNQAIQENTLRQMMINYASTATLAHIESMDALEHTRELIAARTDDIKNHLFEHFLGSIKWYLVNVTWSYFTKPLFKGHK